MATPPGDPLAPFRSPEEIIPQGIDRRVLRYLKVRFFAESVPPDSKDAELLEVYRIMRTLALAIESLITGKPVRRPGPDWEESQDKAAEGVPPPPAVPNEPALPPEIQEVLKTIQIGPQRFGQSART